MFDIFLFIACFVPICLESLPVSSSSHVLLLHVIVMRMTGLHNLIQIPRYLGYITHGPIALLIVIFFSKHWLSVGIAWWRKHAWAEVIQLAGVLLCTTSCTYIWYVMLGYFNWFPLAAGFLMTSCALFSLLFAPRIYHDRMTLPSALILGMAQGIALLPGVSRFGITFCAARWLGFSNVSAFRWSFGIELPISLAACLKGFWLWYVTPGIEDVLHLPQLLTMLVASLVAGVGFVVVQRLIIAEKMWLFGWYTFAIGLLIILW